MTVISGEVGFGMGEKLNKSGPMLGVGAFLANPAKHAHYVWTGGQPAIIQVQFTSPGGIDYINPADDPRKKETAARAGDVEANIPVLSARAVGSPPSSPCCSTTRRPGICRGSLGRH